MLFTKMHGLGNNFILIDQLDNPDNVFDEQEYPELSRSLSDVNFGIGADGIILICTSNRADFKMRIFNEDGSEAKKCGNGLRCVAKFLYEHHYATKQHFTIETLGGVVHVELEVDKGKKVEYVSVDMGEPKLLKAMIPMIGDPFSTAINETVTLNGEEFKLSCLSMGNPHAVLFVDDMEEVSLEEVGPIVEHASLFPDRVNLSVIQVKSEKEINYRVWERGSGITMACGTGACASVVAATLNGLLLENQAILVHLPGGDLTVHWDEKGSVWMRGEAAYVCHGEIDSALYVNY